MHLLLTLTCISLIAVALGYSIVRHYDPHWYGTNEDGHTGHEYAC